MRPRRFHVFASLKGQVWRKVRVEIALDEGGTGHTPETVAAPPPAPYGPPSPDALVTLAMRYQIAQKLHACSDPNDPPTWVNDRPRDIVDLLLLKDLVRREEQPSLHELREASAAVFEARAADVEALKRPIRRRPPHVVAHSHCGSDYSRAAADAGLTTPLATAVDLVNQALLT